MSLTRNKLCAKSAAVAPKSLSGYLIASGISWLCGALTIACAGSAEEVSAAWVDDIEQPLPQRLSDVGIFADLQGLQPNQKAVAFEPTLPLWSNGAEKHRLLHLPEGERIDTQGANWRFPVGTVFAKTFTIGQDDRKLETRLLFKQADRWDYAVYLWDEAQQDAEYLGEDWDRETLKVRDDAGDRINYQVPSRFDCRICHQTSKDFTGTAVIGTDAYRFDDGLKSHDVFDSPPKREPVAGRTATETKVLKYFSANCTMCHYGKPGANSSFSLLPEDAIANTVNHSATSEITPTDVRIVPGDPEQSALFLLVVSSLSDPDSRMPPVGVSIIDPSIEPLLRDWIDELTSLGDPDPRP